MKVTLKTTLLCVAGFGILGHAQNRLAARRDPDVPSRLTSPCGSRSRTGPLAEVSSYEYVIASGPGTPGIYNLLAESPSDLIILGGGSPKTALNRSAADPKGNKLIFGYIDTVEAASYMEPDLFSGKSLPPWFGNANPCCPDLYSVQYWNPAWLSEILALVDDLIADGYDGIFLDVLDGDQEWMQGNSLQNPVYPNATPALATLLSQIRTHINTSRAGRPIYLIGNNPTGIGLADPSSIKNLDVILNEWVYYGQSPTNGTVSSYQGTLEAQYVSNVLAPLYDSANVLVLGGDYPVPLTNASADLMSFEFYTQLGWVPSVTTALQDDRIFSTGPFMFAATDSKSTVTGAANFVNFLSGGCSSRATLVGGNNGDYFIGGPGHNTIIGGAGNDTIYAHPSVAGLKNVLDLQVAMTNLNATTPSVSILINGKVALDGTPIVASYGTATQDLQVDLTPFKPISSVEIKVTGSSYVSQNNYSNVEIIGMTYNGLPVSLPEGVYSTGGSSYGYTSLGNGTVSFTASTLPAGSPYLTDTSDSIDGGAGSNTVVYRSASTNYTIAKNADGSVTVVGNATAEGPDTLRNIQTLQFSDKSISLK